MSHWKALAKTHKKRCKHLLFSDPSALESSFETIYAPYQQIFTIKILANDPILQPVTLQRLLLNP